MLRSYKNREVVQTQQVACFWNLHEDVFSIEGKYFERGKNRKLILSHGNGIFLSDVTFTVNERLRQQVLEKRQKNVHAYVKGKFISAGEIDVKNMRQAYYNPYKQDCFTDRETGKKLLRQHSQSYSTKKFTTQSSRWTGYTVD